MPPPIEIARWTVAAGFALVLIMACVADVKSRRIPNWTVATIIALFIPWIFVGQSVSITLSLAAAGVGFLSGLSLYAFGYLGAGDSKLITAVALFVGLAKLPQFALAVAVAGGILALIFILLRSRRVLFMLNSLGRKNPERNIPYGVAIAAGAILIVFGGLLGIPVR
jgi:prepilin peptidase CpaA